MLAEKVVLPAEITPRIVKAHRLQQLLVRNGERKAGKMAHRGRALRVGRERGLEDGGREGTK